MVNKGKLKMALASQKGVDFQKLHQKKVAKLAQKKKASKVPNGGARSKKDQVEDGWEGVDEDDVEGGAPISSIDGEESEEDSDVPVERALDDESSSESEVDMEEKIQRKPKTALKTTTPPRKEVEAVEEEDDEGDEEEEEDEEDIPMSDLEDLAADEKEDLIPHTRLTINNTTALLASLNRISIPTDKSISFATHQTIIGDEPTASGIEDIQDDLKRELAFYKQSLEAAKKARLLLKAEGVPFSRPNDYFAEMVKDDGHMEKVKARLMEEASAKKASSEARKLRDLKKFGKQVQVAKLQERQKTKRDTLDKIKSLKRKRQETSGDVGANEADLFDIGVDSELKKHNGKKAFTRGGRDGGPNTKRQKKDEKYGFGGKKRNSKSGDAQSSGDLSGFNARRMKTGGGKAKSFKTARLGKNKRQAGAGKR